MTDVEINGEQPCGTWKQHAGRIIARGYCPVCRILEGVKPTKTTRRLAKIHADLVWQAGDLRHLAGRRGYGWDAALADLDGAMGRVRSAMERVQEDAP